MANRTILFDPKGVEATVYGPKYWKGRKKTQNGYEEIVVKGYHAGFVRVPKTTDEQLRTTEKEPRSYAGTRPSLKGGAAWISTPSWFHCTYYSWTTGGRPTAVGLRAVPAVRPCSRSSRRWSRRYSPWRSSPSGPASEASATSGASPPRTFSLLLPQPVRPGPAQPAHPSPGARVARVAAGVLAGEVADPSAVYRLLDTTLVPAIVRVRACRKRLFAGQASFGRSASKTEWVYGFKVALVVDPEGVVSASFGLAPRRPRTRGP
jgi:hypothetical protein